MKTLENIVKWAFCLGVLFVCVTYARKWQGQVAEQNEARETIQQALDAGFAHIEYRNGSALMVPGNPNPVFQTYVNQTYKETWRDAKLAPVGFKFYQEDASYKVEYEVTKVKSSEVEIRYDYNGRAPSRAGHFTGSVNIKSR